MSELSVAQWLEMCEAAARAGGHELLAWRGRFQARSKADADFVTDADLASEEAIRAVITARFPDHAIIGEESATGALTAQGDRFTWLVDPLDGTTNYIHGYPHYATSVALARGDTLLAGVVYDPLADRCFAAARGCGATSGGGPIKTSGVAEVSAALVAVSLPARVAPDSPDLLDMIQAVQVCQAVRRSGSAALNLAYVASGALDAFWATHIHPWDVAAGVLLVREAGGVVTGRDGSPFDLWKPHFLAAAGRELHHDMMRVLPKHSAFRGRGGVVQ